MIPMKASRIAEIVGGVLIGEDCLVEGTAVIASSSAIQGSIFLAFKGEKVDGHDYVSDAFSRGAVLAITSRTVSERCIVVDDVARALAILARFIREQLTSMTVVGITGSQGKTTTKELLTSILTSQGETVSPKGNNNNELGVPLTILQCTEATRFCIVEMGARHIGDIKYLCSIAQPKIGVVLRVAAAHIGEFGSLENIALAKSEMISSLPSDGIAILGDYDPLTRKMDELHSGRILIFGEGIHNEIRATDIELRDGRPHFDLVTPEGRATVALRLYGSHQIANALAAAAVAHSLGISTDEIANGLSVAESYAKWRMEIHELEDLTIINDAYNASPDSMAAALRTLAHLTQERGGESWAFLGKMGELGESSADSHREIGTLASELGIDHLVSIAESGFGEGVREDSATTFHLCSNKEEAIELSKYINRGDVLLCKASRAERLEELADALECEWKKRMKEQGD